MLRLNIGLRVCPLRKHSQTMRKNFFPKLLFTLISKGGLYHVIFLFLDLFFGVNLNLYVYSLLSSAAWYVGAALLNTSSSDEMFDSLWFIFYILWDSFDDVRWVIAFRVYIRWYVSGLHERIVFSGV